MAVEMLKYGLDVLVAQLDRAPPCGGGGRAFKSHRVHLGRLRLGFGELMEGGQDGNALVSKTNERKL